MKNCKKRLEKAKKETRNWKNSLEKFFFNNNKKVGKKNKFIMKKWKMKKLTGKKKMNFCLNKEIIWLKKLKAFKKNLKTKF
jgi:hypothetical protein